MLQAIGFIANAQCGDSGGIQLTAESTPATCYNDGTIKVTISGPDANNLRLTDLELRLSVIDGVGQSVDWTPWDNANSNIKTFREAVRGNYLVEMRAFCHVGGEWVTSSANTTIAVGGSYEPLVTTFETLRKSMNCKPTGEVALNFTNGRAPFSGTIIGPPGYTGPTTFNTSSASFSLGNVCPAGDYRVTFKDACDYGGTYTYNSPVLANDVVSTLYTNMARLAGSTDCRTIVPDRVNDVFDPSENYYWINSGQYYEYAYTLTSTPPAASSSEWKTLTTRRPEYVLPQTYKDFCNSGSTNFYSHIRPIGCPGTVRSISHYMGYICPVSSGSIFNRTVYEGSTCNTAKISIFIYDFNGVCYPANWKITPTNEPNNILQSGTLYDSGTMVSYDSSSSSYPMSLDYPRGVSYTISLTDNDGNLFSIPWTPPIDQGQTFSGDYSYSMSTGVNCMVEYGYIMAPNAIISGTKFKYLEGPIQTLPCGLSLNDTYTIQDGWTSPRFYFTGINPNDATISNFQPVPYGNYKFEITNNCGVVSMLTIPVSYWGLEPLNYTKQQTCSEGLKVTFNGSIYRTLADGSTSNQPTYYRITSGPPGFANNNNYVLRGSPLTLPIPGTYTIGVFYNNPNYCNMATTTVEYPAEGLYIDPELTSAYACEGTLAGRIRVQAIDGVEPYTYTVTSAPGTAPITPQTNNTGVFPAIGQAGGTYIINVKDACNTEFSIPITMINLMNASIVYTTNDGKFCNGGKIELNCVALGNTTYLWRGPNGYSSTEQRPRPTAIFPESTGTYTVRVTPEGCAAPIEQSLYIEILQPESPNVTNSTPSAALNSGNANVVALSGASASLSGYTLKWYNSATGTTTISAPTAVSTATLGSTDYYVSQANASGCESGRLKITFTVYTPNNSLRVNPHLRSFFDTE